MRFFKGILQKVDQLLTGRRPLDEELLEELEEALVQSDVSFRTASQIVEKLREEARNRRISDSDGARTLLQEIIAGMLAEGNAPLGFSPEPPSVYLIVGVNGTGKTTTIAKIAHRLKKQGKRVLLAAADTFRAAAIDQLELWGQRIGVEVIKHRERADPAAVVFDALQAARARKMDVVIADTAGRLHTKVNLMEELKKIGRIVDRELARPPDETLLVLDATTGQNAVSQAEQFGKVVPLTGIVLTKMDGTARGGIVITIKDDMHIPIKLVGVGEKMDDLEEFDPKAFAEGLFA
ncbi:MAG: signal recognition particle-docking protein FtsY [Armatimonadetes bacterium]|nr:signal recognition particle-docking protein FtsY [Armatimonadota bacterium]